MPRRRCACGPRKKVGRPVKWTADRTRSLPRPTRTAATTSRTPSWRSTPTARSWRCGPRPRPTSAPISRPSPRRCRPTSTRRCCRASTTCRRSTARSTASTPTPRRSTPTAAPAGPRPPSWSSAWSRWRRAQLGHGPGRVPAPELHHDASRTQTPVILTYDAGDYDACLDKALEMADYAGLAARKAESAKKGKQRGVGFSAYIEACGIAPSAGGRLARRRRRPVGIGGGARQPDRHGRGAHRLAQPRPGPRDDLRPARLAAARHPDRADHRSCTATPTRCSSAWAPTARAPARSACRRSSRRSTR